MQDVGWDCPVLDPDGGAVARSVVLTTQVVMPRDGGQGCVTLGRVGESLNRGDPGPLNRIARTMREEREEG